MANDFTQKVSLRFPWLAVIAISVISIFDFQYFSEANFAETIPPTARGFIHLLSLTGIFLTGMKTWKKAGQWYMLLWISGYFAAIFLVVILGIAHYYFDLFSYRQLVIAGMVRPFFTTPAPFLILYVLRRSERGIRSRSIY